MKTILKSYQDIYEMIEFIRGLKKPYTYKRTTTTITLIYRGTEYFACNMDGIEPLPINQLYFIRKTKSHILQRNIPKPNYSHKEQIKYLDFNKRIKAGTTLKDCYAIDINSAYWKSAYHNGFIENDIYKEGEGIDKRIRLAGLGTFAKNESVLKSNGINEVFTDEVINKNEQVFFNQAHTINLLMDKCKKYVNGSFIIYWVDCIMVKDNKSLSVCKDIIKDAGYGYKEKLANTIERTKNAFMVNNVPFHC